MIKINNISELDGLKEGNYVFSLIKEESVSKIVIENKKEKTKIEIGYNKDNVIGALEKIKKLIEVKIQLNELNDREVLSYKIGRASCRERVSSPV